MLYQIYPRSFADANGDGVGDLAGLTSRLDYLEWLGVDGVWLNPITPSPNADWGYDASDYTDVDADLGTLADLDRLVAEAGARGIRVLLDLVPNHTSIEHPWFRERPDFYVWADEIPNNWRSIFGGPAWTLDPVRGRYYLHLFAREQPDLDWWNEDVRAAFDEILRFWFDRGVAGFRIDVAHAIVKDRELRDDAADGRAIHSMNRPEVHDVHRRWRRLADGYEVPRILVGETYVTDIIEMARYYGENDELNLAFNFAFVHAPLEAQAMRAIVEATEAAIPRGAWPVWTGSNHDVGRLATRWARGDERKTRCALLALLALRGTPVLYYGDELGLPDVDVPDSQRRDSAATPTRDPCRTPMPWTPEPGGGFTDSPQPWLPLGDLSRNVRDQRADSGSTLAFTRELIALRRRLPDLRSGGYESLAAPDGVWAWTRGDGCVVALNLSDAEAAIDPGGAVAVGTTRTRDGDPFDGRLGSWEGVILRR